MRSSTSITARFSEIDLPEKIQYDSHNRLSEYEYTKNSITYTNKLFYDPIGRVFRKEIWEDDGGGDELTMATHYYYDGGSLVQEFDEMLDPGCCSTVEIKDTCTYDDTKEGCECMCCPQAGGGGAGEENAPAMMPSGGGGHHGSVTPLAPGIGPWGDGGDSWGVLPMPYDPGIFDRIPELIGTLMFSPGGFGIEANIHDGFGTLSVTLDYGDERIPWKGPAARKPWASRLPNLGNLQGVALTATALCLAWSAVKEWGWVKVSCESLLSCICAFCGAFLKSLSHSGALVAVSAPSSWIRNGLSWGKFIGKFFGVISALSVVIGAMRGIGCIFKHFRD